MIGSARMERLPIFVAVLLVATAGLAHGYLFAGGPGRHSKSHSSCRSHQPGWPACTTRTSSTSSSPWTTDRHQAAAGRSTYTASSRRFLSKGPDEKKQNGKEPFSLSSLFGKSASSSSSWKKSGTALRGVASNLEPHPSVRDHVSPLNLLYPGGSKAREAAQATTDEPLPVHPDVRSGVLSNGLSYVILPNKSPPGRFEAHLQVFSGSCEFSFDFAFCPAQLRVVGYQ